MGLVQLASHAEFVGKELDSIPTENIFGESQGALNVPKPLPEWGHFGSYKKKKKNLTA